MIQRKHLLPTLLMLTFIVLASFQFPDQSTEKDLKSLDWMLGTWERTNVRPGTTAFEKWEKKDDRTFTGMGWSMKGKDTTFIEKLRLEVKEDALYYVADVRENATPTYFKITEQSKSGFKSENPDHDFPKVISYQLEDKILTAIISDGGDKKMGFVFKRMD